MSLFLEDSIDFFLNIVQAWKLRDNQSVRDWIVICRVVVENDQRREYRRLKSSIERHRNEMTKDKIEIFVEQFI
jgi:hypothetical protein